jgi:Membrane bound O-acyl transferase family
MGACSLSIIIFTLDFLFLAREDEQDVKDAKEYRQWLEEKGLSPKEIKEAEEKVTGGNEYSMERPKYFPGTKAWLPFDIAMSPRAFGYVRGQSQRGAPFQAGYKALIASERLEAKSKTNQREIYLLKVDNIIHIAWNFLQSFLISDLMMAVLLHPSLLGMQRHIKDNNGFMKLSESTQSSKFGPTLTPWITAMIIGALIPLRMHMVHLFAYFFTLLFTPPHKVPITVSRYEPLLCPRFSSCTSLQSLWSEGWHQLPRRQYTVIAMRPSAKLARRFNLPASIGRAIGLLFAFFLSGISHELSLEGLLGHIQHIAPKYRQGINEKQLRGMGYGFGAKNYVSTRFFLSQAIVIIFEGIWSNQLEPIMANILLGKGQTRLINGKMRNVIGWIWCTFWITWPGIALVDVWSAHGIMCPVTPSAIFTPLFNLFL